MPLVAPEASKEIKPEPKAQKPKKLTGMQEAVLEGLEWAQSTEDIVAVVATLKPEERNDKRVGFPIQQAMDRIISQIVPLP